MTRSTISLLALLLSMTACSQPANTPTAETTNSPSAPASEKRIASADVVKAVVQPIIVDAGGTTEALVQLTIQNGYHVNANPPTFPYLRATSLEVPGAHGISLAKMTYPKALERKFAFADQPIAVYEGTADLRATLKADKNATPGQQSLPAQLRIQACDEQVCYPPGTLEVMIPVTIK